MVTVNTKTFFWGIVSLFVFGAHAAHAAYCQDWNSGVWFDCGSLSSDGSVTHNAGPTWANGLPQYVDDETVYYLYDPAADKYTAAKDNSVLAGEQLYVHFKFDLKRWVWAGGNTSPGYATSNGDWRAITPNSKLQGKRIGYASGNTLALDWYRLSDDWLTWKRVTDRDRPVVYRWDTTTNAPVVGETAPDNWAQLGGTLDPLPGQGKPTCALTLSTKSLKAQQPLTVHIAIQGDVTDIEIEGQHPTISRPPHADAYADLTFVPPAPGSYTTTANIKGAGGEGSCSDNYTVDLPEAAALKCQLTVDKPTVAAGDSVIATLTSTGGKVTAVEIAGASVFNFFNQLDGSVNLQSRVAINRQDVDARTGKVELQAAVHTDTASATCGASVAIQ